MTPTAPSQYLPASGSRGSRPSLDDTAEYEPMRAIGGSDSEDGRLIQAIFLNSTAVIYVKDREGRFLLVNGRFEELFRLPFGGAVGRTDFDFLPTEDAAVLRANDSRVLQTGSPIEFEEVIRRDGTERTFLSLKFPIAGPGGGWESVCGISTDITARKQSELCLTLQHGVTRALAGTTSYAEAAPAILECLATGLGFETACLWALDPASSVFRVQSTWQGLSDAIPVVDWHAMDCPTLAMHRPPGQKEVDCDTDLHWAAAGGSRDLRMGNFCGFSVIAGDTLTGAIEFWVRDSRLLSPQVVGQLRDIGRQIGQFVEQREAKQALRDRYRELEAARRVQRSLLPPTSPLLAGFSIGGSSVQAQETGGDYFDYIPMPDGSLGVAIGDASGHGMGAALVIAQVRAYLRARAATDDDVSSILAQVNRHLVSDLPEGHFVTLLFAKVDGRTGGVTYASAGHWPGYILSTHGEVLATLPSTGYPLGVDPNMEFPTLTLAPLRPDELVLFVTDGVVEAMATDDSLFGVERALAVVRGARHAEPGAIVAKLLEQARQFSAAPSTDDMTAVVLKAKRTLPVPDRPGSEFSSS